jgi:hypothetical protein
MSEILGWAWRLGLTLALLSVILVSLRVPPPRTELPRRDLHRLVGSGALLYVAGAIASLAGRPALAAIAFGAGILVCWLAVWLSRGGHGGEGWDDDREPPVDPDPGPDFDWDEFERELADYTSRVRA